MDAVAGTLKGLVERQDEVERKLTKLTEEASEARRDYGRDVGSARTLLPRLSTLSTLPS